MRPKRFYPNIRTPVLPDYTSKKVEYLSATLQNEVVGMTAERVIISGVWKVRFPDITPVVRNQNQISQIM